MNLNAWISAWATGVFTFCVVVMLGMPWVMRGKVRRGW